MPSVSATETSTISPLKDPWGRRPGAPEEPKRSKPSSPRPRLSDWPCPQPHSHSPPFRHLTPVEVLGPHPTYRPRGLRLDPRSSQKPRQPGPERRGGEGRKARKSGRSGLPSPGGRRVTRVRGLGASSSNDPRGRYHSTSCLPSLESGSKDETSCFGVCLDSSAGQSPTTDLLGPHSLRHSSHNVKKSSLHCPKIRLVHRHSHLLTARYTDKHKPSKQTWTLNVGIHTNSSTTVTVLLHKIPQTQNSLNFVTKCTSNIFLKFFLILLIRAFWKFHSGFCLLQSIFSHSS